MTDYARTIPVSEFQDQCLRLTWVYPACLSRSRSQHHTLQLTLRQLT